MKLIEIIKNPHVNQLTAILAVSMTPEWRASHPEMPEVRETLETLWPLLKSIGSGTKPTEQFVARFMALLARLVMNDPNLHYSPADLDWIVNLLESDASEGRMVLSMIFSRSIAGQDWFTAEQLAELTTDAASTWRNRAATGEVIARKAGKTWLFGLPALLAYGVDVSAYSVCKESGDRYDASSN